MKRIGALFAIATLFLIYAQFVPKDYPNWIMPYIFVPIFEELKYRYIPLMLVKSIEPRLVHPTLLLSSMIFGLAHVDVRTTDDMLFHVCLQGVFGYVFGRVMLKYTYWHAVILHALWNFLIVEGWFVVQ